MREAEITEFYDLHCHFLPGMDDGCQTPEESLKLLEEQYRQGCRGVAATPHYYAKESIQSFLERRENAAARLVQALKDRGGDPIPSMTFGAEVAYRETLVNEREMERLCLGKSRYLLLEMPFTPWTERTLRGVERLANTWGIIPVIAHIERYSDVAEKSLLEELMNFDFPIQLNAGNFGNGKSGRKALRLIRGGRIQVLGTDSHNTDRRPPNMNLAIQSLKRHGMAEELEEILQTNAEIFRSARGEQGCAEENAKF
jgi:protein-tyrosine phosphatase